MAAEVGAAIPSVSLRASDAAGTAVPDVVVTMDGGRVPAGTDGASVEVNPGPHEFHFEAKGFGPLTLNLVILEGKKDQPVAVTLTPLTALAPAPAPAPAPSVAPATAPAPSPAALPASAAGASTPDPGGLGAQKTIALIAGGVGVVSLGVGLVFGVDAGSHWSSAKRSASPALALLAAPRRTTTTARRARRGSPRPSSSRAESWPRAALCSGCAPSKSHAESALRVAPTATAGGAGLSVGGAF